MSSFLVNLKPTSFDDEVGYSVEVPPLPGCVTEGDTMDQALANARDAISAYLESLTAGDRPVAVAEPIITTVTADTVA